MVQRKLRVLLTISYYHMLIYGLMPTKLKINKSRVSIEKISIGYMIYSLCLTGVLLLEILYMTPSRIVNEYMLNNIVLQWSYLVKMMLNNAAILSCYGLVWLRRQRLIQLYKDFLQHWRIHWFLLQRLAGAEALQRLQLQLAFLLHRQFYVNYGMVICLILIQYQLADQFGGTTLLKHLLSFSQVILFSVARIGCFTLLLLLSHQFGAVQLAVQALHDQGGGSRSLKDLRRVAAIHTDCLKLSRRAFSMYNLVNASTFAIMFVMNVNVLYHAVQFTNNTIKSNFWGTITGEGLVFFNVWNSILVMNMVDYTVNSCNSIGQLIRQFSDLRRLSPESQMQLELFVGRLRTDPLVYRICGFVVLDKPACLGYIASVLGNVIILMQFDLRRSQEKHLKYDNLLSQLKRVK